MLVRCLTCGWVYDDYSRWTICPHGPLGFGLSDYCRFCDTVIPLHGLCPHQLEERMNALITDVGMSNLLTMSAAAKVDPRQALPAGPCVPDQPTRAVRAKLILEEALETIRDLGFDLVMTHEATLPVTMQRVELRDRPDFDPENSTAYLEGVVDGCCDLIYVATGTILASGVPDRPSLELVCRKNNAKFPGGRATVDANGKYQKPLGWTPPNHNELLQSLPAVNIAQAGEAVLSLTAQEHNWRQPTGATDPTRGECVRHTAAQPDNRSDHPEDRDPANVQADKAGYEAWEAAQGQPTSGPPKDYNGAGYFPDGLGE